MFCTQCGHQIPDGSQFCPECGSKVVEVPTASQTAKSEERPNQEVQPAEYPVSGAAPSLDDFDDGICPKCGSHDCEIQVQQNVTGSTTNYRAGAGCLGFLLTGPFGLLCGLCGTGGKTTTTHQSMWVCKKCGHQFLTREGVLGQIKAVFFTVAMLIGMGSGVAAFLTILLLIGIVMSIGTGGYSEFGSVALIAMLVIGAVGAILGLFCMFLIRCMKSLVQQYGYNTIEEYLTQEEVAEIKKNSITTIIVCGVVVFGCLLIFR